MLQAQPGMARPRVINAPAGASRRYHPDQQTREGTDREPSRFAALPSTSRAFNRFGHPSAYLAAANRDGSQSGATRKIPRPPLPRPGESHNTLKALVLRRNTAGSSWVPIPPSFPKPTAEANRCNLRHVAPKTLQKALYVGFSQASRPQQVVCFGWSRFPIPEARLAG